MSVKKWEDYSKEEQTNYLTHWFHYYGNMMYNFQELEDFRELAKTRQDDIFNHIVTEFLFQNTIQSGMLLTCMRDNKIEELFQTNLTREKVLEVNKDGLSDYEKIRDIVVSVITGQNQKEGSKTIQ